MYDTGRPGGYPGVFFDKKKNLAFRENYDVFLMPCCLLGFINSCSMVNIYVENSPEWFCVQDIVHWLVYIIINWYSIIYYLLYKCYPPPKQESQTHMRSGKLCMHNLHQLYMPITHR